MAREKKSLKWFRDNLGADKNLKWISMKKLFHSRTHFVSMNKTFLVDFFSFFFLWALLGFLEMLSEMWWLNKGRKGLYGDFGGRKFNLEFLKDFKNNKNLILVKYYFY